MKIGLIDIDSKIPNLALMKISAYHKQKQDVVKWWNAFEAFDLVYGSKIFSYSQNNYLPKNSILGGSGYNYKSLSNEIEHIYPDYSLYGIDYAMGYLTRGCINQCPFCIVPKKEGKLRKHAELKEFWKDQTHLLLLDNALTDYEHADIELKQIRDLEIHLDLCQGFNVRRIKPTIASILADIKLWKNGQWKIAWDDIDDEDQIMKGIQILNQAGIKNYRLMCYVLVNFDSTLDNDLYRINKLQEMKIEPFVMIYNRHLLPKHSIYQRLGKWCNRPQLRESCTFKEYNKE
jgi:hypothetical protein